MSRQTLMAKALSPYIVGKNLCGWSQLEIIENQVKYLIKEDPETLKSCGVDKENEDAVWKLAACDGDLFRWEWAYLREHLTEILQGKEESWSYPGEWHVEYCNFGWQGLTGYNIFSFENGKDMLQKVLPDTDCTFQVYEYGKDGLALNNFHHDSPYGREWYYLTPLVTCEQCGEHYLEDAAAQQFLDTFGWCPVCMADEVLTRILQYSDESMELYDHVILKALEVFVGETGDVYILDLLEDWDRDSFLENLVPLVPYGEIDSQIGA